MENKDVLFYEDKKKLSHTWLLLCIISFIVGIVFLCVYISKKDSIDIDNVFLVFGCSFFFLLGYFYLRPKYVRLTEKELETILYFQKRVYKLETLTTYECKKAGLSKYYYFIMYFGKTLSVVSVFEREKFSKLLDDVIEKNKANQNENHETN